MHLPANAGDARDQGFNPWIRKIPWTRKWQPVFLPGKPHAQRSLEGRVHGVRRVGHG